MKTEDFKVLGIDGVREFKNSVRFLDTIVNHYASYLNPNRVGLFLGFVTKNGLQCVELTDINGKRRWYPIFDKDSKLEIIGTTILTSGTIAEM